MVVVVVVVTEHYSASQNDVQQSDEFLANEHSDTHTHTHTHTHTRTHRDTVIILASYQCCRCYYHCR